MARIHLVVSPTPPEEGAQLKAMCGAEINNASAVALPDFEPENTVVFCKQCFNRKYWYAVAEAQDVIDLQAGAA